MATRIRSNAIRDIQDAISQGVASNPSVTASNILKHTHSNKTTLDAIVANGDGSRYLANDGTYKVTPFVHNTTTINGQALSGNVSLSASDVGLGNVDNTSDLDKPISIAVSAAISNLAVSGNYAGSVNYRTPNASGNILFAPEIPAFPYTLSISNIGWIIATQNTYLNYSGNTFKVFDKFSGELLFSRARTIDKRPVYDGKGNTYTRGTNGQIIKENINTGATTVLSYSDTPATDKGLAYDGSRYLYTFRDSDRKLVKYDTTNDTLVSYNPNLIESGLTGMEIVDAGNYVLFTGVQIAGGFWSIIRFDKVGLSFTDVTFPIDNVTYYSMLAVYDDYVYSYTKTGGGYKTKISTMTTEQIIPSSANGNYTFSVVSNGKGQIYFFNSYDRIVHMYNSITNYTHLNYIDLSSLLPSGAEFTYGGNIAYDPFHDVLALSKSAYSASNDIMAFYKLPAVPSNEIVYDAGVQNANFTVHFGQGLFYKFTTGSGNISISLKNPAVSANNIILKLAITQGATPRTVTLLAGDANVISSGGLMSSGDALPNSGGSTTDIFEFTWNGAAWVTTNALYDVKA